jgi:hypothetical protein
MPADALHSIDIGRLKGAFADLADHLGQRKANQECEQESPVHDDK